MSAAAASVIHDVTMVLALLLPSAIALGAIHFSAARLRNRTAAACDDADKAE